MAATIEFLRSSQYFSNLGDAELQSVASLFAEKTYGKGETIIWEGTPGTSLYFVASGAVKCFKLSEEGKEQILQIILPGQSFNDVAVFDDGPSPAGAEAMSLVRLYAVSRDDIQDMVMRYPQILTNVVKVLTERIRHLLALVEDLSFRHVINRIAKVLVEYAGDGVNSKPRLTQQEMAAMVGTAREVVGRSLKTLQEEGLIKIDRHRLVIANKAALEQMAAAVS